MTTNSKAPKSERRDLRQLVQEAAHGDRAAARALADEAVRVLAAGETLPRSLRLWLVFVLRRLRQKNAFPSFAQKRGARGDPTLALLRVGELYLFLDARRKAHRAHPVNVIVDEAARELGDWARKTYYSPDFAEFRKALGRARVPRSRNFR